MTRSLSAPWRTREPGSLSVLCYLRPCGYHVILAHPGKTIGEALRPEQLGKSCVPYKVDPTLETMQSEAVALAVGLANIAAGAEEDCPNL